MTADDTPIILQIHSYLSASRFSNRFSLRLFAHLTRATTGFAMSSAGGPTSVVAEGEVCGALRLCDRQTLSAKRRIRTAASATSAQIPR
jgi:hypothetical protein